MKKMIYSLVYVAITLTAQAQNEDDEATLANDALPIATEQAQKAAWLTSIEKGIKRAKAEKKLVMIEFTGSDWCPPCMMMDRKVFSKQAFIDGVKKEYVIVKLDMPNSDPELKKANEALLKKYKVEGVPTVILLEADGEEYNRFVASQFRTVSAFLKKLAKDKRRKDML